MKVTYLRARYFPARYPGNRGALYRQLKPLTVQEFRRLLEEAGVANVS